MFKLNGSPRIIFLEGVDRSGKDSIWYEIDIQTKYKHINVDRGPIGFKAYCEIFNKAPELMAAYDQMEKQLESLDNVLVIYLDCSTEELIRRCKATNHEILDFDRHKKIYEKYFNASNLMKVRIDTTGWSAKDIVETLIAGGII